MAHRTEIEQQKLDYEFLPGTVGIDWLGVFIPATETFTAAFRHGRDPQSWTPRIKSAKTFHVLDGVSFALVTPPLEYGSRRKHRLEFHRVGSLSEAKITNTLAKVVAVDPLELRVARFDATADVTSGITMGHVRGGLQVRHKQKAKEYVGSVVANHRFETMYFGETSSDSFIRVYDKARQLESAKRVSPVPQWVRMERVVQGRAIPDALKTLGGFFRHGANFEPFHQIEFVGMPDEVDPSLILNWRPSTPNERRNALYSLTLVRIVGRTRAGRILREEGRNKKDALALLDRAVRDLAIPVPTAPELNQLYQAAFRHQMAGHDNNGASRSKLPHPQAA